MKHKITWLLPFLLIFVLIFIGGCEEQAKVETTAFDPTPVIAKVGGVTFHESDIDREIRSMPGSLQHIGTDPVARRQILHVLIQRSILSQKAQEIGLEKDPLIASQIMRARNTILIEALENWQTSQITPPSDKEIEAYYNEHLSDFTIPEQIHARHILVGSEKLAWEILKKLKRNHSSFEALAATHSLDDSNKSRGGDLNWFPRGIMVAPFEKAAFSLKEKGLSKPIKTQFGWHIIEALGKRPAHIKSLDEARDEIQALLLQDALDQWVDRLISKTNVSIVKPEYQLGEEEQIKE